MKIKRVRANNHKKAFEIATASHVYAFPYALLRVQPNATDRIEDAFPDEELGREGFTYRLANGREDTIHMDAVLEYNRDPSHMNDLLVHRLTLEARRAVEGASVSKRELIRILGTSASQFYRLLDPANRTKSIGQLIALLHVLGKDVDVVVSSRGRRAPRRRAERGKVAV